MAIAFDASATAVGGTNSSLSFSHTCAAGAKLYFAFEHFQAVSSVTCGGSAMTNVLGYTGGAGFRLEVYEFLTPATGSNTIALTLSAGDPFNPSGVSLSYTGTDGQEASATNHLSGSTANLATSVTTVTNNAWLIGFGMSLNNGVAMGSGSTSRQVGTYITGFDSNGGKSPAGAYDLNSNCTGTSDDYVVIALALKQTVANTGKMMPFFFK